MSRFTSRPVTCTDSVGAMSDALTVNALLVASAGALTGVGVGLCLGLVPSSITGIACITGGLTYAGNRNSTKIIHD